MDVVIAILGSIITFLTFNKTAMKIFLGMIGLILLFITGFIVNTAEIYLLAVFVFSGILLTIIGTWRKTEFDNKPNWGKIIMVIIGDFILLFGTKISPIIWGF